jgi:hypothetical protein
LGLGCLLHGWFHVSNNQDYARIDKSKGEDFLFITATAAATAYAAFVGDGDPVDGLETIGFVQLIPFCTSNIAGLIVNILYSYI